MLRRDVGRSRWCCNGKITEGSTRTALHRGDPATRLANRRACARFEYVSRLSSTMHAARRRGRSCWASCSGVARLGLLDTQTEHTSLHLSESYEFHRRARS